MLEAFTRNWWASVLRGVIAILFGTLLFRIACAHPGQPILFFGAYALVDGAFNTVASLFSVGRYEGWWVSLPGGLVSIGAGKSTLISLIPRFYDPTAGTVRLDGVDLKGQRLRDVRDHRAAVPQETQLFSGTIQENVRFGKPEATDTEVTEAAMEAFLPRMPIFYIFPESNLS